MSATDAAKAINSLLASLEAQYGAPEAVERDPIEEIVFSFLLWESATNRAEHALKRLLDSSLDLNELRVTRPEDVSQLLGKTYPLADERADRMHAALNDLYNREHAVSLETAVAMPKREGRKYVESLDGIPPFVAARVALMVLGAHAVPLDERTLKRLVEAGVADEDADLESTAARLERHIKAADGARAHGLLQAWSEDTAAAAAKAAKKKPSRRRPAAQATGGRTTKGGPRRRSAARG